MKASGQNKAEGIKEIGRHTVLMIVMICVCSVTLLLSIEKIVSQQIQGKKEQTSFITLKQSVLSSPETTPQETLLPNTPSTEAVQPAYTPFYILYQQNHDFEAWLTVPGTEIDYPVMYSPHEPMYYLNRAFDKASTKSGSLYIDENSSSESDLFLIHGHNMKNKTMFGTLEKYRDEAFWKENQTFSYTTIYEHRTYEVFAAIETRLNSEADAYNYYYSLGDLKKQEFESLIYWIKKNSLYETEITPSYREQLVILSTCSYHTKNGRFLVVARRIE